MSDSPEFRVLLKRLVRSTQKQKSGQDQMGCEFCMREIMSCTYLSCHECNGMPICVHCFCQGKEKASHSREHRYRVMDSLKFPLFVDEWTAKEEKLLLEGVLKFGFGNWVSIGDFLGKTKTARECELHFRQIYLSGQDAEVVSERNDSGYVMPRKIQNPLPMPMDTEDTEYPSARPEPEKHALMEFAGYMPLRSDFEFEYDNDIEMYLADLEFYDEDGEEDRAIKLRQLQNYNKVLDDRDERKTFVIQRWMQELKTEKRFRGNVVERNVYHAMKPYARYLTSEKHSELCEMLVKECLLRMKLAELNEAKRQGLRTEAEFRQFLTERRSGNIARQKEYEVIAKEELEATKEDLEATKEELGSMKEELEGTMAEQEGDVQELEEATKEELEATKEELEGTKEEICAEPVVVEAEVREIPEEHLPQTEI